MLALFRVSRATSGMFCACTDWANTANPNSISKIILLNCFMDLSPNLSILCIYRVYEHRYGAAGPEGGMLESKALAGNFRQSLALEQMLDGDCESFISPINSIAKPVVFCSITTAPQ